MKKVNAAPNVYYDRMLFVFRHAAAFLPLVMIPFGLLVRTASVDSRFYVSDTVFLVLVVAYVITTMAYFYFVNRVIDNRLLVAFMVLFHVQTLLFVLFVSGFLSAYLSVWIILMISADLHFGNRGFLASFTTLGLAGLLMIVVYPEMPINERIEVVQGVIVVGLIGYVIARIRSITDRERVALARTREQESFQRERLLALINSMGDAVVTTDEQGTIKVYNAALLGLLDTNESLVGKNLEAILKLENKQGDKGGIVGQARDERKVFSRTDLTHRFANGEHMRLYINVAPIKPSYQSRTERGFIFIMRDITKEKTLEEERDEFISVVSHELRTPIAIAEGSLSNLQLLHQRGAKAGVMAQAIVASHEQVMYLSKLVNDLSTLSRAERGVGSETEIIDTHELLQNMYHSYMPQAEAKKLQFNIDIAPKLPLLRTSRLYMEEILQNLIVNSIKYTREGDITLQAELCDEGLRIAVKDSGIGISKSDQKHIFEKFYRSEDYRTRESGGTGLGLYVCKKLAEKMGATLSFESRLNHGSTFYMDIPTSQFAITAENERLQNQAGQVAPK